MAPDVVDSVNYTRYTSVWRERQSASKEAVVALATAINSAGRHWTDIKPAYRVLTRRDDGSLHLRVGKCR